MTTFHTTIDTTPAGSPIVRVFGDLDVASTDGLITVADEVLGDGIALTLDLGEVTFMDSTGLGALIKIRNHIIDRGGDFALSSVSSAVVRVLVLVGMADLFGVEVPASE